MGCLELHFSEGHPQQEIEVVALGYRIPVAEPEIGEEELDNVMEAVKSGWVSSKGRFIPEFEEGFSEYIGARYGIATSNGTAALHLALTALGLGRGDKVLVPSLSFIAVANAVKYTGAEPVFVDSNPDYWCMDPSDIEKRIDRRTKALLAVHLYGHPCDMGRLREIAESNDLLLIEDCAEAHGAKYKGVKVGSFGAVSCFSFYGNKIITTGEGGMCLTDDSELDERMRILRDHGMNPNRRFWHDVVGFNYRMTNLQAALGVAQLGKIDRFIAKKRRIAEAYSKSLEGVPGLSTAPEMPWAKNVYWMYSVIVRRSIRNRVMEILANQGIETRPFFHPIHRLPPYEAGLKLPVAERLGSTGLNLPVGSKISDEQIEEVAERLALALCK
jgi:perosamine synthetase